MRASFYVVQPFPSMAPSHIKLGFSDSIDRRLEQYRCLCPEVKLIKRWPCRDVTLEKQAIAFIASIGFEQIGPEVFKVDDLDLLFARLDVFFKSPKKFTFQGNRSKWIQEQASMIEQRFSVEEQDRILEILQTLPDEKPLRPIEVQKLLNITASKLATLVQYGYLLCEKVGARQQFWVCDLKDYMLKQSIGKTASELRYEASLIIRAMKKDAEIYTFKEVEALRGEVTSLQKECEKYKQQIEELEYALRNSRAYISRLENSDPVKEAREIAMSIYANINKR